MVEHQVALRNAAREVGIPVFCLPILTGMSANLCVESHCHYAIENGFEVIIVADATAGTGPLSTNAALVNYEFIANDVVTIDQIIRRLRDAK